MISRKLRRRQQFQLEYVARGFFLGGCIALLLAAQSPLDAVIRLSWPWAFAAAAVCLLGFRIQGTGSLGSRVLFVVMRYPTLLYISVLAGLLIALAGLDLRTKISLLAAGSAAGLLLGESIRLRRRRNRFVAKLLWVLGSASLLILAHAFSWLPYPEIGPAWTIVLLGGAGLWFLLLLAGSVEESELEIGLGCAAIAGAWSATPLPVFARALAFAAPVALFVVYCERVRRQAVAFKETLRGLCCEHENDLRAALIHFRLSLAAAPSAMAAAGNWRVHRAIDISNLDNDPDLREMIDSRECLIRSREILDRSAPAGTALIEAHKLLRLVESRRRDLPWTIAREHLRLLLAAGQTDDAETYLKRMLPTSIDESIAASEVEAEAMFRVWHAALSTPGLIEAGMSLLAADTGLLGFIASLERRRTQWPDDPDANGFRPFAYERLTWAAFIKNADARPGDPMPWFGYDFCMELGLSAANARDLETEVRPSALTEKAVDLLRIAARGLPHRRLEILHTLAQMEDADQNQTTERWRTAVKDAGLAFSPANLSPRERNAFDDSVRKLGEIARHAGDIDGAIENYELLLGSPRAGLGTLQILQTLHEDRGDVLSAIRPVEAALSYSLSKSDQAHYRQEKRRLYGSLDAEDLSERISRVPWFDADFCFEEAHRLFDDDHGPNELEPWLKLAALAGPDRSLAIDYMRGRLARRMGDDDEACRRLELVCQAPVSALKLPQADRRRYDSMRILVEISLESGNQLDRAYGLLRELEKWSGSGAATLVKLGQICERLDRPAEAQKWYELATIYSDHHLADEARSAAQRLKSQSEMQYPETESPPGP